MSQPYFMGIDGGGSTLRIVITDNHLNTITTYHSTTANPNIIGHHNAVTHIQAGINKTLEQANLQADSITAIGLGIAGASNLHSAAWLRSTVKPIFKATLIIPSSDLEVALVGALAQRHGILVLAGTGSAVFGISPNGETIQLGGWGYLLGDEGSGYWIGLQAIKQIIQDYEQHYYEFVQYKPNSLNQHLLDSLDLASPRDLIHWLYQSETPPVNQIAPLTKVIVQKANENNWDAINLLQKSALILTDKVNLMTRRLAYPNAPIAFGGGLLNNGNRLSQELTTRLNLTTRPIAKYSPVVGGALLAQLEWKSQNKL